MRRRGNPVSFGSPRFKTMEAGPFLVTDAWFPPGAFLPRHHHDRTVVGVTIAGQGNSVLGRREVVMTPGILHTEPAGETHSNLFADPGARIVVVQPDAGEESLSDACKPLLSEVHRLALPEAAAIARRVRAEMAWSDALSRLAIESACLELLAVGARAAAAREPHQPAWLPRVLDYLHAHFRECPTIAVLSALAGVHPTHFARAFRRAVRQSPASYVRRLRIDWAADALRSTDRPLVEIAAASGFADQSHFTRAFRRQVGATPGAFRRRGGLA